MLQKLGGEKGFREGIREESWERSRGFGEDAGIERWKD